MSYKKRVSLETDSQTDKQLLLYKNKKTMEKKKKRKTKEKQNKKKEKYQKNQKLF